MPPPKIRILIFALTVLLASAFVPGAAGAQERQETKLGAILPLTGVIAPVGEALLRGLQMANYNKHIKCL
jgi:hypothetical protein